MVKERETKRIRDGNGPLKGRKRRENHNAISKLLILYLFLGCLAENS